MRDSFGMILLLKYEKVMHLAMDTYIDMQSPRIQNPARPSDEKCVRALLKSDELLSTVFGEAHGDGTLTSEYCHIVTCTQNNARRLIKFGIVEKDVKAELSLGLRAGWKCDYS